MAIKKKSDKKIQEDKTERIMKLIAIKAAYFRANPHRFATEYLGLNLKWFQKFLLWAMFYFDNLIWIAARGLGKTYIVSLFSDIRCILYPGTKIVVTASTYKQAREVILKTTDDFMQKSPLLSVEILKWSTGQNDCYIMFKNGSWIRVYVATESSRGARSNCIIVDESRLIPQKIIDTIFRPMNSSPRQPGYLRKPEYYHLQEMNKEMHLSSAWYAQSELFEKVKSYAANMLNPNYKYFACDLPYQISIREGLLMKEQIQNEMSESTFNEVTFTMEREGLFWGAADDSLFKLEDINKQRVLAHGLHCLEYYNDNNLRVPEKQPGEIRLLSIDIALMASKKHNNDASAFILHSAVPTADNSYLDNIVYVETQEGLVTDELGLEIMRKYYQYDCDYIVVDANGVGAGVLDYLLSDRYDPKYGQVYPALNVINNDELADRCRVKNAPKVIWAIKANAKSNNDMCLMLRAGFQNGNINLLISDQDCDAVISKIRGYSKQTESMQTKLKLPYVQTSLLINELINLTHEVQNGLIKVKEKTGMRKDRYSSLEYGYYVIQELSKDLKPKQTDFTSLVDKLIARPAKRNIGL